VERNLQRNGLVNLLALLLAAAAGYGIARYTNSLAGQAAAAFLGLGALVAFVSWFQMGLEARERLEKLELDELARSKGSATLFEGRDAEVFPAQRSRQQFEKFFVPGFAIVLLCLQGGGAFLLWRWLAKLVVLPPVHQDLLALALFGLLALILFLIGRFSATIARLENHRLLRPSASYLLLGAYLCFFCAAAMAGLKSEFPKTDLYVARGFVVVLGLVAAETLAALVFEIYRPRVKGKVGRPLYDSRLVGLLAQPEGLVATAAQTLDYQFGFKVSETWFFLFFRNAVRWMLLLQLGALLVSTSIVFIEPGEQALLERFGKPLADGAVLGPGPHLKLPWPVDKVYRYQSEQVQTVTVGGVEAEADHASGVVLWTAGHPKDENFLVAKRAEPSVEAATPTSGRRAPPVSLITVSIPVQFQITNLTQWVYTHEDSSNLLRQIATREVVRYLASVDVNEIMSHRRLESALELREHVQGAADRQALGVRVLFVGLQDLHPPVKVAPEYQKVVAARHQKQAKILEAEADSLRVTTLAGAQAVTVTNAAEAARINLQVIALARAAAFTNQLPAFNAAPTVYRQRAYLSTFASATAKATKYLILATNTAEVISFDLQRRLDEDYFNKIGGAIPPPKK